MSQFGVLSISIYNLELKLIALMITKLFKSFPSIPETLSADKSLNLNY